jgi:hypothetical protein
MRKTLTVFCLMLTATAAYAETTVREYDDHVVVEVTGVPQTPDEKAQQELQERISAEESERQRVADEMERLKRKEDGAETMDFQQRRAEMVEKRRQKQQADEELRELAHQQASTLPAGSEPITPR